jgi:exopolysaccharide biosynthesis polyprenyl glycosylphosphotransferase
MAKQPAAAKAAFIKPPLFSGRHNATENPLPPRRLTPFAPPLSWKRGRAYLGRQNWTAPLVYLLLDVALWFSVYYAAAVLRQDAAFIGGDSLLTTAFVGLGALLLTLFVIGGYDRRADMCSLSHTSEHLIAMVAAAALASLLIYSGSAFGGGMQPSRGALLVSFVIFAPVSLSYRRLISRTLAVNAARKFFFVLGTGPMARDFYAAYQRSPSLEGLRFIDPLDGTATGQPIAGRGSPIIEADALTQLEAFGPESNGVILAEENARLSPAMLDLLIQLHFRKVPVYTLESFYETQWRRVPVQTIDPIWPLQTGFQLARDSPYYQIKRLFDILCAGTALALLSPLLILLVLLTWLDSGRPALFRQTRIGRNGRPFTIYKFRTMFMQPTAAESDAPSAPEDLYTQANDRRITRLGRSLRKLRLDELPQFWNVLLGDMSLIGPRAEWDKCVELYQDHIPCYRFRHLVKPGITGWAQVNYPYGQNEEDALQKLKYDLYYIRHYSLRLDAMIILKTLHIMLWGKGM